MIRLNRLKMPRNSSAHTDNERAGRRKKNRGQLVCQWQKYHVEHSYIIEMYVCAKGLNCEKISLTNRIYPKAIQMQALT